MNGGCQRQRQRTHATRVPLLLLLLLLFVITAAPPAPAQGIRYPLDEAGDAVPDPSTDPLGDEDEQSEKSNFRHIPRILVAALIAVSVVAMTAATVWLLRSRRHPPEESQEEQYVQ